MGGEVPYGKCKICGKETVLEITVFRYDINCECHNNNHVERVEHCRDCEPKAPGYIRVILKGEDHLIKE